MSRIVNLFFWFVPLLILSACNSGPAQPTLDPTQGIQMLE